MNNRYWIVIFAVVSFVITPACHTLTQKNKIQLSQQLKQYLGKKSGYITEHLDLNNLGIKINPNPVTAPDRIIFSFDRVASIAIPLTTMTRDSNGVMIPVQIATVSNSYDRIVSCNMIFLLENDIAQSVSLKGKAC